MKTSQPDADGTVSNFHAATARARIGNVNFVVATIFNDSFLVVDIGLLGFLDVHLLIPEFLAMVVLMFAGGYPTAYLLLELLGGALIGLSFFGHPMLPVRFRRLLFYGVVWLVNLGSLYILFRRAAL